MVAVTVTVTLAVAVGSGWLLVVVGVGEKAAVMVVGDVSGGDHRHCHCVDDGGGWW
jgi:hypothetical protein